MKFFKLLFTLILILQVHTAFSQKDKAFSSSALGLAFGQPGYVEFERLATNRVAFALRLGYRNHYEEKSEFYYGSTESEDEFRSYTYSRRGATLGSFIRLYPAGIGLLEGLYVGIGGEIALGEFISKSFTIDQLGRERSMIGANSRIMTSGQAQFGIKILAGKMIIDPSVSFILEGINDPYRGDYQGEVRANFHVHPALGFGVRF